jgi:hypothetical protein
MSTNLVVNNNTFPYPESGDSPGWGESATDWASEVTYVLGRLHNTNDILETNFAMPASGSGDVDGLYFDPSQVRSFTVDYYCYRVSTVTPEEVSETGFLCGVYNTVANNWSFGPQNIGDAKVTFSITNAGQVQYSALPLTGTYDVVNSKMKFSAKTILQV